MDTTALILIVDDKPDNLDVLVNYLANSGMELMVATDGEQALDLAAERVPDIVLLDVMMPGIDGYEVCKQLKAKNSTRHTPVIFMSALTQIEKRVKGFNVGGIDFINKPLQREEVLARIDAHLTIRQQQLILSEKNKQLESLNKELKEQIDRRYKVEKALNIVDERLSTLTKQEAEHWGIDAFIGQSLVTRQLMDEVRSLQQAPKTNVLVLGESGTGKELVSRAIHYGSPRNNKSFVAVNCSAIPAELADSEFFGHGKGAYTGAVNDRNGYFVQADGGTLFLDEVGDMPLMLQAKLLRVLEDGIVTPVGGRGQRKVDVRVVAATNVDLHRKVQNKEFRQDLYFRLAGYQIALSPLRERHGDIELLVEHFLNLLSGQMGRDQPLVTREALLAIASYRFPGNVRELKNLIEYALIASRGQPIQTQHLHFLDRAKPLSTAQPLNNLANLSAEEPESVPLAAPSPNTGFVLPAKNQEELLIEHAKTQGRIDNTVVQRILSVDHGRASYLLKKLHSDGRLTKQGERRWAYYTVPIKTAPIK